MISNSIYKRDSLGNVRFWRFEVEGDSYRTHAGVVDGTTVTSGWTICTPKSQPTAHEQAIFEARAAEQHKLTRTYFEDITAIDNPIIFEPMLAKEFNKTFKDQFPVISQPKLDGIRCITTARGLFTRQGKPITAAPHIAEALEEFFEHNPDMTLDGELYNHDLKDDFNQITSIVRRQKNSPSDLRKAAGLIQYHVYDAVSTNPNDLTRLHRFKTWMFHDLVRGSIHLVESEIATTQEELDRFYAVYLEAGYEGQMVRLPGPYQQKRSGLLLKRKEFQDDEFTVIDIQEGLGNWAGYGKKIVCQLPDGREFGAGVKGNQVFTKDLLQNRGAYIGKKATIQFFALTPDGIPRFPVATKFDRLDA